MRAIARLESRLRWTLGTPKVPMPIDYEERERLAAHLVGEARMEDVLREVCRLWFLRMEHNARDRPFQPSLVLATTKRMEEMYEAFRGKMSVDGVPYVEEKKRVLALNLVVHDLNRLLDRGASITEAISKVESESWGRAR